MWLALLASLVLTAADGKPKDAADRVGKLDDPAIKEASGIVASRRHPGIFWVHNDSGNPPALFAVRADGSLVRRYKVAVPNVDWEDIAADGAGHLYLGDIGNNDGVLPVRAIHRLDEPDPTAPAADAKLLRVTRTTYYRFPDKGRFDAEALVVDGTTALLIAKTQDRRDAEVYAVALDVAAPLYTPALPKRVGTLAGFDEAVTGADLSADGKRLAVVSLKTAAVYERAGSGWALVGSARFKADGVEAIAWDGDDLILAGEDRGLYRIAPRAWQPQPKGKAKRPR